MAHNDCMTTAAFEQFFDVHTKSLQFEFRRIDNKIDDGFDRMEKRFQDMDEKFKSVDEKFKSVDEKFKSVDERFNSIDERFKSVDQRFDALEYRMIQNEARARNSRLSRLHQKIQRISVLDPTFPATMGRIKEPVNFPMTVRDFWNLRKKPGQMVYLLRFYNLSGWKGWGLYSSDIESSDSESEDFASEDSPLPEPSSKQPRSHESSPPSSFPQQPQTLEDAVGAHPELALQEIAEELGLDYDRIESTVQAYKAYHAKQTLVRAPPKRSTPPVLTRELFPKRQRQQPRPSPPVPVPHFTVEDVEASVERYENPPPPSEPSVHTELGWAVTSEEFREKRRVFYGKDRVQRQNAAEPEPPFVQPRGSQSIAGST